MLMLQLPQPPYAFETGNKVPALTVMMQTVRAFDTPKDLVQNAFGVHAGPKRQQAAYRHADMHRTVLCYDYNCTGCAPA